jgi:hypothetical protein
MINLSLDDEPPSKFEGKKEVNKKKSEPLHQLIFSLRNRKNKIKFTSSRKNLEEQIKSDLAKYIFDAEYLKTSENYPESNSTPTVNVIEFTNVLTTNQNQIIPDFNYGEKKSSTEFSEKKFSNFYEMKSSYYFAPETIRENKKEDSYEQPKEEDSEEIPYMVYAFEEEGEQESLNLK